MMHCEKSSGEERGEVNGDYKMYGSGKLSRRDTYRRGATHFWVSTIIEPSKSKQIWDLYSSRVIHSVPNFFDTTGSRYQPQKKILQHNHHGQGRNCRGKRCRRLSLWFSIIFQNFLFSVTFLSRLRTLGRRVSL